MTEKKMATRNSSLCSTLIVAIVVSAAKPRLHLIIVLSHDFCTTGYDQILHQIISVSPPPLFFFQMTDYLWIYWEGPLSLCHYLKRITTYQLSQGPSLNWSPFTNQTLSPKSLLCVWPFFTWAADQSDVVANAELQNLGGYYHCCR